MHSPSIPANVVSFEMRWRDPVTGETQVRAVDAAEFDSGLEAFVSYVMERRDVLPPHLRGAG